MKIILNDKETLINDGFTIENLIDSLKLNSKTIVVEVNLDIIAKDKYSQFKLQDNDKVEIIHFVGGGQTKCRMQSAKCKILKKGEMIEMEEDKLIIAGKSYSSRLLLGTGKYPDFKVMAEALGKSGTEIVTVAVRRVNLDDKSKESLLYYIDKSKYTILPNTAVAYTVYEAVRIAHLASASGLSKLVKLEVIGDEKTLMPDTTALLEATKILVKDGFTVLPYTNDDCIMAKKLENAGASAIMPLASPIGSGQGILNPLNIILIKEAVKIPIIVDAGVGTASDAAIAMELGVDGILMNTGVALAKDPVKMALAMRYAVMSGRLAYLAGRMPKKKYASASSPLEGTIN